MPSGKNPLVVKEFKGKLVNDIDTVFNKYSQCHIPFEYGLESINLDYLKKGGMRTRKGFEEYTFHTPVVGIPRQFWKINSLNGTPQSNRWLILTWDGADGRLFDTGVQIPASNPVLVLAGMKYAFVINAFNRMYITPWEAWARPLTGGEVYLYNGSYNARKAGCPNPNLGTFTLTPAGGGNITPGAHILAVIFETDTGYRTLVGYNGGGGPLQSTTTTTANATINITNIPVGAVGLGVVKRHIVMTKVVVNYDNKGFLSYEPFIVQTIEDNFTTTATITTPDSGLVDSAKELVKDVGSAGLIENDGEIRATVSLAVYGNRMVYIGATDLGPIALASRNTILISPPNVPEHCSIVYPKFGTSPIVIGPDFSGGAMIGEELNNALYIFKEDSTFSVIADDNLDPAEWPKPALVDSARGAFPFGVAKVGNNPSSLISGRLVVVGNHGVSIFDGRFTERSLSEGMWEEYKLDDLKWAKIVIDPLRYTLFMRIGEPGSDTLFDAVTPNNFLITSNYFYGYDISEIRWGKYILPVHVTTGQLIARDVDLRDSSGGQDAIINHSLLVLFGRESLGGSNYKVWLFSEASTVADFSRTAATPSYPSWEWMTGYTPNDNGETFTFGPIKVRINTEYTINRSGNGNIIVEMGLLDDSNHVLVGNLVPGTAPKKYMSLPLNNISEHLRVRIRGQNHSLIQSLVLFMIEAGKERPRP